MGNLLRNIIRGVICILAASFIYACGSANMDEDDPVRFPDQKFCILSINISPIVTRDAINSVRERISSFRIIIIDGDSVELNKKIDLNTYASDFYYFLTWPTSIATKKIYLFANEERVNDLQFETDQIPPGISAPISLTDFLDTFKEGTKEIDFPELIYFNPDYEINEDRNVYLPYASFYEIEVMSAAQDLNLYLVPAAAKFTFNFYNYRLSSSTILLEGLSINEINPLTYLFGQVGEDDLYKNMPEENEPSFWIDWLAKVSKMSQNENNTGFSSNVNFNNIYGWIKDYSVPETGNDTQTHFFFEATDSSEGNPPVAPIEIKGGTEDEKDEDNVIPYILSLGPYYVPESKNTFDPETDAELTGQQQKYYLTIYWKGNEEGEEVPEFSNQEITNLPALFRNTHVIINFRLKQGDVEIYAEIADWNYQSKNGWVIEGSKPNL